MGDVAFIFSYISKNICSAIETGSSLLSSTGGAKSNVVRGFSDFIYLGVVCLLSIADSM